MDSRLTLFCRKIVESSWLAAAVLMPLFFNISSVQTFEPDKVFVLRSLAILSGAAWLLTRIGPAQEEIKVQLKSFLKIPLVKPLIALTAVYILSSVFSIVPVLSWWGSYRRAQGTAAFLCYMILFLVLLAELHQLVQLRRLQFAVILTSIPVAGYAILQHFSIDPLPWNGIVQRASGSMGNPIFLGGYLVMVIPPTFSRLLEGIRELRGDEGRKPGLVLVGSCCIVLLLQLCALLCTQSRGPVAGLLIAAYICVLILAVLNRSSRKDPWIYAIAAAGIGLLAPVFAVAVIRYGSKISARASFVCLAVAIVFAAILYLLVWRTSWGRFWFWLTWLAQLVSLLLILALSQAGVIGSASVSSLGRLGQFRDPSVNVRKVLWETSVQYLRHRAPAVLPDGTRDSYHFLRPAIGYGPECSWMPANLYAVPSLVQLQPGQTVDRMHNEAYDTLMMLGGAGTIAYLVLIAAVLFYAFLCLGFDCKGLGKTLFFAFSGLGVLTGITVPLFAGAPYLIGIGVVVGLLAGTIVFVAWSGFRPGSNLSACNARQLAVLGIVGAVIAHLIDTGVGIAVTPTRVYFYMFLGILAVISTRDLVPQDEPAKNRHPKTARWFQNPLLPYAALSGLVLLVESWCFTFNTATEPGTFQVFLRTWFFFSLNEPSQAPAALILLLLTFCASIALIYSEKTRSWTRQHSLQQPLTFTVWFMIMVWILTGILSAVFWAAGDRSVPVAISRHAEARMTLFGIGLLLLLSITSLLLHASDAKRHETRRVRTSERLVGILMAVCVIIGGWEISLRPAWADIAARIAVAHENAGNSTGAIQLFERSADLAPREPSYWTSLGLVQGASVTSDGNQWASATRSLKCALDLNPLDPDVQRTIGAFHVQTGERSSDPLFRTSEIQTAISYFKKASMLAPNFPDAYSETGRCFFILGEYDRAMAFYTKSLQLSPNYSRTHMFLGEMHYRRKNLELALQSFSEAARLDQTNIEARKNVAFLLALLGRRGDAIRANLATLHDVPGDVMVLKRLAILYFGAGDYSSGLVYARRAYDATPNNGNVSLDQFIDELKNQSN